MKKPALRTLDVFFDRESEMIKPKELIEWLGAESLTLTDRRRFNLMLINAWPDIAEDKTHEIRKAALRGSNKDNERVYDTAKRLMSITPSMVVEHHGKPYVRLFHIIEETETGAEENEWDGLLRYRFSQRFRSIVTNSTQYAQLKKEVIYALPSKYALALYEIIAKRVNLDKTCETVDLKTFRQWLGVEEEKLTKYSNLLDRAIKPAVQSVNALAEFECAVEPVKRGKRVVAVLLSWKKKNIAAKVATLQEHGRSKVGRTARLAGTVEHVASTSDAHIAGGRGLSMTDIEKLRDEFGAWDFDHLFMLFKQAMYGVEGFDPDNIKNPYHRLAGWLRNPTSPIYGKEKP